MARCTCYNCGENVNDNNHSGYCSENCYNESLAYSGYEDYDDDDDASYDDDEMQEYNDYDYEAGYYYEE